MTDLLGIFDKDHFIIGLTERNESLIKDEAKRIITTITKHIQNQQPSVRIVGGLSTMWSFDQPGVDKLLDKASQALSTGLQLSPEDSLFIWPNSLSQD